VTFPASLTSIGDKAFVGCDGLTSVTLPDSVTTIGRYAFYGCFCLTSVTFPASLTGIGHAAFYECECLSEVICNAKKEPLIGTKAFYGVSKNCILKINQREGYNPELWGIRVKYE
jgi:hypothetical protein